MTGYLLKNCAAVIIDEGNGPSVRRNVDLLTRGPAIQAIRENLSLNALPEGTIVQDASGWFVYPGLVNTHHHFFQCAIGPTSTGRSFPSSNGSTGSIRSSLD
jgi:hydroxyatrazine ethylaminohydrolase